MKEGQRGSIVLGAVIVLIPLLLLTARLVPLVTVGSRGESDRALALDSVAIGENILEEQASAGTAFLTTTELDRGSAHITLRAEPLRRGKRTLLLHTGAIANRGVLKTQFRLVRGTKTVDGEFPKPNWKVLGERAIQPCDHFRPTALSAERFVSAVSVRTCDRLAVTTDNTFVQGNLELDGPVLYQEKRDTVLRLAVLGTLHLRSLVLQNCQSVQVEIIAGGGITIDHIGVNGSENVHLVVHSGTGKVVIAGATPHPNLCAGTAGSTIPKFTGTAEKGGTLNGISFSGGSVGCPYDRDPAFWPATQLLGEGAIL